MMFNKVKINDSEMEMVPVYLEEGQLIYLYANSVVESCSLFIGVVFRQHMVLVDKEYVERFYEHIESLGITFDLQRSHEFYTVLQETLRKTHNE